MKKTILLFLLLVVGLTSIAQSRHFRDVVYLNDSSSIKGRIHFEEPDSTLFVDTPYGCTFAYTKDKVQRYQLESQMPFQRHKGFVLQSSMAAGANFSIWWGDASFGVLFRTGSIYSVGLGANCLFAPINHVIDFENKIYYLFSINVYLDQRIYFSNKPTSPFLEIKAGLPCITYYLGPLYLYDKHFYGELDAGVSIRNIDLSFYVTTYDPYDFYSTLFGIRLGYSFPLN